MAGITQDGLATTENYYIGRGIVYLAELVNGQPTAWRDIGNVCDLSIEADTTTLEHFSCRIRTRTKDAEVITGLSLDFNLVADEWMYENLAAFFVGESSIYAQTGSAGAAVANAGEIRFVNVRSTNPAVSSDNQVVGRYYDVFYDSTADAIFLGSGDANTGATGILTHSQRIYDIDPAQLTIDGLTAAAGGWEYDAQAAQVFVPEGSVLGTNMIAAWNIDTDLTKTLPVAYGGIISNAQFEQVQGLTGSERTLALKFVALNGATSTEVHEVIFHQAKIRPQGNLGLIQEDGYGQITLAGSLEQNTAADPDGGGYVTFRQLSE